MNKNWAGSKGVITLLAFMASAALLLSAYSFYTFRKQNLNLDNAVTLDAASSQLKVWNGNEWQNIGGAQPGQVLGIIDGKPGWIETSESTSDSFTNTVFSNGLVRTGDKNAYTLSLANCNSGQVLQATGSSWECTTITNPTPVPTYSAGSGINISGSNVISSTLGTSISTGELDSGAVTNANLANDSVSGANIINGTIMLADLNDNGCNPGQILKYNGSGWACASDNAGAGSYTFTVSDGTNVQTINDSDQLRFISAGTLSVIVSASDTVTLDVANNAITTGKILDSTIGFADIGANGCANGQTIKFNGTTWTCGTDNVNDADASATNELQNLSLAVNVLSISGGNSVNLAPYLDNTDAQNLSYVAGTQLLSISGGNNISLANLLDNTDSQAISKSGDTLSITGSAGTVDLSSYLDNTDVLASLSCSNGQVAQWNGSAWICANAGADTDDQTLSLVTNSLSISEGNAVSLAGYLDNTDAQAISRTGNTISITGNAGTVDLSPYLDNTDGQNLSYVAGTQTLSIGGGNSVSLNSLLDNTDSQAISKTGDIVSITGSAGTVDLSGYLDNTDAQSISKTGNTLSITGSAGTVDLSGYLDNTDVLAGLSCSNTQIAKYNGSAWVCAADNVNDADADASNELQDLSLSVNVLSLSGSASTVNLAPYLDNTDSQAISKTGNTLSITGNAGTVDLSGYLDNTDVLGSLSCSNTQIAKYNGSVWVCAADNDTDTTYSAGTGISLVGTTFSTTLGTNIDSSEIADGAILFADLSANSCTNGQIVKYNGSTWTCGADNVNDADASATNELQDLSVSVNLLSLSSSAATIDLSPYLDNTDAQNLSYVAGTQTLSIGGGNSVSLASLLDNTDSQAISKTGNTVSITGSAGTVDLSPYLDNTDVLASLSCSNGQVAQWNGSAWVCANAAVDTDAQTLSLITNSLAISNGNAVSLAGYLDNTDAQAISRTGNTISITGNAGTVDLSPYLDNTDSQNLSYVAGTQTLSIGGGNSVSLSALLDNTDSQSIGKTGDTLTISGSAGTVDLSGYLDNTDVQAISKTGNTLSITGNAGTVDLSGYLDNTDVLAGLSCSNTQIAKYNGSAWVCAADNVNDADASATNELQDLSLSVNILSLSGSAPTINLAGYLDNTDSQSISKTGNTLSITGSAGTVDLSGYLDNTDVLGSLSCSNTQIAKYNGSTWVCAADNDTDTTYSAGSGISLVGTTFSATLGTDITSGEIADGTILFGDIASNSCTNNQIFKYNGSAWICGTDVDTDTDTTYSAGTGVSFAGTVISTTLGTGIDSSEIVDGTVSNTDLANSSLTVTAGTGLTGGGAVSLGGTVTLNSSLGTVVDTSEITDGTILFGDLASNGCSNTQTIKYNGSAWVCAADNVNDADASATNELQDLSLSVNVLSLSGSAPTVDLSGYLDNTDAQNLSYVAGTQALSIGGGNSVSLSTLLDNTDSQAISKTGNTLSITGNAGTVDLSGYLDNTDVLGSLSCSNTQIAKYNGSTWVCAADNDTDTTYSAGTGLTLTGTTFSVDLGADISSGEIVNGTILFADIASNSCGTNDIFKYNGSAWYCGADVDTDTDTTYSAGTGVSFAGTVISTTLGTAIDSSEITDGTVSNTDLANSSVTVTAGTGLTGGGAVSLGGTVTLNSSLGTAVDTSEITDGTILFGDLASNSCGTNDIIKFNGSAWICGTDLSGGSSNLFETIATTSGTNPVADSNTDTLNLAAGTGVTVTGNGTTDTVTFAAVLGIDIDSSEIVDGTIDNIDIANATIANGKLVNSSLTVTAGTGLTGGGAVSLGGTVTLNSSLGTAIDNTEITDGTLLFADIASNGCGTNDIFKYNGSAWVCGTDVDTDTTYSAGTGISFGGTVISSTLGTDIDSAEIVNGTIVAGDVASNTFAQLGVAAAQTDTSTNGLLFINKTGASGNLLQLQVAGVDTFLVAYDGTIDSASVDSASIVNSSVANADLVNSSLTVTAGTGITGGGSVSLGGTVTLTNAFGSSIDSTEVTVDVLDFTELKDSLALDATTTIAAGANNFVLNLDGAGDFLVQDNATTVLSVLDNGTFLFKNSADSASSFVIQDLAGIDLFSIDTANDRVYIGDPTSDTTGSLLVLDTKSGAGDPTGVNGAMYYNGASNKSRCYEGGTWQDCISRYRVRLASDITNNNAVANTMADVTGLSFNVTSGIGYQFECNVWYTAAATTTGSRWSINGPATTNLSYTSLYTLTATTNTSNTAVAYNIPAASNASSGYTTGNTANIRGYITPSANGTVIVRFASEIANSAIVAKAGSSCEYWVP